MINNIYNYSLADDTRALLEGRIGAVLAGDGLSISYQPIFDVADNKILGFESLARFSALPEQGPDIWFDDAAQVGLKLELELLAIERALLAIDQLPPHVYVAVNASPETVLTGALEDKFRNFPLERIVLEVTEREAINIHGAISVAIAAMRARGLRLAIDDMGGDDDSLQHVLNLSPDIIKLDVKLTKDIDIDASRQAMAVSMVTFARAVGCKVVAEGVETMAELTVLRRLRVHHAQGFFLGKPMPLETAAQLVHRLS
jgi:EAL domain-containing protein (putative c-di-GMP-specific phosphodiesterase class I)